jgi:ABC-type multidrug transport system ATPase subunit
MRGFHPLGGVSFRLRPEARAGGRSYRRPMTSIPLIEPRSLAVQTAGLGKRFGSRAALEGVDLEVPRGSAFGFLGPNGAGKTTLIRLLLGLAQPSAGRMRLLGHELPAGRVAALARVGAIIEEPRFHPHLTGRENLEVHAAARDRGAHARIDGALARVGLAARGDDRVKAYSLGMRQRLGVARCLLADPELLVLDEPMNGLDPAGILEFRRLIRELVEEGRTVLLSSHLLDEVEKTRDVAAIVDQGRVVAQGTIHKPPTKAAGPDSRFGHERRRLAYVTPDAPSGRSARALAARAPTTAIAAVSRRVVPRGACACRSSISEARPPTT